MKKTENEWKERARELLARAKNGHGLETQIVGPEKAESVEDAVVRTMLKLGREMADERAGPVAAEADTEYITLIEMDALLERGREIIRRTRAAP
jgi:hypothetical protein